MMQFEVILNNLMQCTDFFNTSHCIQFLASNIAQQTDICKNSQKRPGSGSAIRKNAGSGSALNQCGSATIHGRVEEFNDFFAILLSLSQESIVFRCSPYPRRKKDKCREITSPGDLKAAAVNYFLEV
jgi:hypothetical protein